MAYVLTDTLSNADDPMFTSTSFLRQLEAVMDILATKDISYITPEPSVGYQYEGDFYGLLAEHRIDNVLHWVTLRVNGMKNPCDYIYEEHPTLIIPDLYTVQKLRDWYVTSTN